MRLREYEQNAARRLTKAGVDSPRLCAQLLAGHVLGLDRLHCVLAAECELTPDQAGTLEALTARRATGEPLAHILGDREFFGRTFLVTPDTLIPRPETELLVETALELLPAGQPLRFADLGAGSGCIGVTLCLERPRWCGLLLELSAPALEVARANAARLGAATRLDALRADLRAIPLAAGSCDLLVSNPPYIADAERGQVMDEAYFPGSRSGPSARRHCPGRPSAPARRPAFTGTRRGPGEGRAGPAVRGRCFCRHRHAPRSGRTGALRFGQESVI